MWRNLAHLAASWPSYSKGPEPHRCLDFGAHPFTATQLLSSHPSLLPHLPHPSCSLPFGCTWPSRVTALLRGCLFVSQNPIQLLPPPVQLTWTDVTALHSLSDPCLKHPASSSLVWTRGQERGSETNLPGLEPQLRHYLMPGQSWKFLCLHVN